MEEKKSGCGKILLKGIVISAALGTMFNSALKAVNKAIEMNPDLVLKGLRRLPEKIDGSNPHVICGGSQDLVAFLNCAEGTLHKVVGSMENILENTLENTSRGLSYLYHSYSLIFSDPEVLKSMIRQPEFVIPHILGLGLIGVAACALSRTSKK